MAFFLLASAGVHFLARAPRSRTHDGDTVRATLMLVPIGAGVVGVVVLMFTRVQVVQRMPWSPFVSQCGWYGLLIGIGAVTGLGFRQSEHDANDINADKLRTALREYRSVEGRYPDRLAALVPKYIVDLPRVQSGLSSQEFVYGLGTGKEGAGGYVLKFHDSLGVMVLEPGSAYLSPYGED